MAKRVSSIDRDMIYEKMRVLASEGGTGHFLEDFMASFYFASSAITKMQKSFLAYGNDGSYIQKGDFYFQEVRNGSSVDSAFMSAQSKASSKERFIIVTDYKRFMARDTKTRINIDVPFNELANQYEFFLPLVGIEKHQAIVENAADVKAAAKMAELFDEIKKDNLEDTRFSPHAYSIFLTRLLFCLFADDTEIFQDNLFQDCIELHTDEDGSNLGPWLEGLFTVLDLPMNKRLGISPSYAKFPYVNGGLFSEKLSVPSFSYKSREKLLECCSSDWSQINPDIFGSMFQGAIDEKTRSELGQHYTSVPNIMKVIKPLFLDDLHEELNSIKGNDKKLDAFRVKLSKIKIFDPACGSGNFLIIAYKELCRLEMEAIESYTSSQLPFLSIELKNFYGIEIDEFPCDVARLALWLAQHQINLECYSKFGNSNPTLPLTPSGNIICGNACRLDWEKVCPCNEGDIVYICGNPPFLGGQLCSSQQKEDFSCVFNERNIKTGMLDYVSNWYIKGAEYICKKKKSKCAFVSTNSINQGVQISFWNELFSMGVSIGFAYSAFKWSNNAKNKAGVTVVIIGLYNSLQTDRKYLFSESHKQEVTSINPYLVEGDNIYVVPSKKNLSKLNYDFLLGTCFADGGNLILNAEEKEEIETKYPQSSKFIKELVGADELINGKQRWCLWIKDDEVLESRNNPIIDARIESVRRCRMDSKKDATKRKAQTPWKGTEVRYKDTVSIIIPEVSSESREYIPIGYLKKGTVVVAPNFAIYDAPLWLFSILESKMHMAWMRTVCGKLETRYRYSNTLCYNTFPFPSLTEAQKAQLETTAMDILMTRETHYDMTLAQQYDPDTMPEDLRKAHDANDLLVDSLYRKTGFDNDEERLEELFRRYKKMTEGTR